MRAAVLGRGAARQHLATEVKGLDTSLNLAPIIDTTNTNAGIFVVNLARAGTGFYSRIGNKIRMKSLRVRGIMQFITTPAATTADIKGNWVRMAVVYDSSPNSGSIPTYDTIFGNTDQAGTTTTNQLDALKFANTQRFSVLRDRIVPYNPPAITTAGTTNVFSQLVAFDEFIPLKGAMTQYSTDSSPMTIADIEHGALYVIFRANTNDVVSYCQITDSQARLRYYDK